MSSRPKKKKRRKSPVEPELRPFIAAAPGAAKTASPPKQNGRVALIEDWPVPGICVFLAAIVWIVFGQTPGFDFVSYDDTAYITDNPVVQKGLTLNGLYWAMSHGEIGHWHPLTWLGHMADCGVYGLWAGGHHLTNVLLHCATAVCLFLVLRSMTSSLWRSAMVAALWAVHPLRAESVAWISERKDVLSGLFFVLTLGAYARYVRRRSAARYCLVVVFFVAGLLSKNMLVTLPCVLLLLDYWPLRRRESIPFSRLLAEKIPLFALSAASCAATFLVPEKLNGADRLPLLLRLENAVVSYVIYLRQSVWPADLAVPYPNPRHLFSAWIVAGAVALLAAASAAAFLARKRQPGFFAGWFWFTGMLVPVIGFVQISNYAHADRYTYLPQIGLWIAAVWGAADCCRNLHFPRWAPGLFTAGVIALLMIVARKQVAVWRDSESLWTHSLASTKDNYIAESGLGIVFHNKGQVEESIAQYRKTIEIKPDYTDAQYNLGHALQDKGQLDEAILHYKKALESEPDSAEAHNNLGNALLQKGNPGEAMAEFQKAREIKPGYPDPWNNLAYLLATCPDGQLRNGARAVELALKAAQLTGGNSPAVLGTLAASYAEAGRFPDAIEALNQAIRLAEAQGNPSLAGTLHQHLKLYQAGQPLRDSW